MTEPATIDLNYSLQGLCPYLGEHLWINLGFTLSRLPDAAYVDLLNRGFRRSGCSFYRPVCACQQCLPIRIHVPDFHPGKSQRQARNRNRDLRIEHRPAQFSTELFALYRLYQSQWHQQDDTKAEDFSRFLLDSPVTSEMLCYFAGSQWVGAGWIDRLPGLLSSVYFIFDPSQASRRLGVYSILYELDYARALGLDWLYLGFWVQGSRKMAYKAEYQPAQLLIGDTWVDFSVAVAQH